MKLNRIKSIFFLLGIYCAAILLSFLAGFFLPVDNPLVKAGIIDFCATVFIFKISISCNNSSVYDPYWSVAPMALAGYWIFITPHNDQNLLRTLMIAALILFWSNRLTYNFFRQWKGFIQEDWRYVDLRKSTRKWYWFVSFFGIHFFPTVMVFLACVPVYFALTKGNRPAGAVDIAAFLVTLSGIMMETIADNQLRSHVASHAGPRKTLRTGLRRYSRHPNYFGEIMFWWGMYLFAVAADVRFWWSIFGPVGVTLLFIFIFFYLL